MKRSSGVAIHAAGIFCLAPAEYPIRKACPWHNAAAVLPKTPLTVNGCPTLSWYEFTCFNFVLLKLVQLKHSKENDYLQRKVSQASSVKVQNKENENENQSCNRVVGLDLPRLL